MKKKYLVVFVVLFIIVITGCDKKQSLVCTKSENSTGMNFNTTMSSNFVNDSITSIKMDMNIKLESNYVKYADTIKSNLETQYSKYKNTKGITYNTAVKDDVINFTLIVDNKAINKETRESLKLSGSGTYKANKKALEKDGYSCK